MLQTDVLICYRLYILSHSLKTYQMVNLTKQQEWKLDKIRKEANFLWFNKELGDEVFLMGKEGKSDNEITWALWQKEGAEKF